MSITKYNNPMFPGRSTLSAMVDDFFNKSFTDMVGSDMVMSRPSVNVKETDSEFIIDLAAPGLEKDHFNIKLEHDLLKISAQKEDAKEESGEHFTRREFNFSSFSRTFELPENTDREKIEAAYEKGVLTITLPKNRKTEQEQSKQIKIS